MIKRILPFLCFLAADTGSSGGGEAPPAAPAKKFPPVNAPGSVGPGAIAPDPNLDDQLRRQARASAKTLRAQAEEKALVLSRKTKTVVEPEKTATEDEIFQMLKAGGNEHDTPIHATSGPNPGVQALRPGESSRGPASGILARGALIPDNQTLAGRQPVNNAPGLGADTGIKATADNPDARAADGSHVDGVDPADPGTAGAIGPAPVRHDTAEEAARREKACAVIREAFAANRVPTRQEFLDAGCPENLVDDAIRDAETDLKAREEQDGAAHNREALAATASSSSGSSESSSSN